MNRHESRAFLRSDEDDPDYLRDKPMGRCPWCGGEVSDGFTSVKAAMHIIKCAMWDADDTVLENRARYQEERMAAAKIEEKSP